MSAIRASSPRRPFGPAISSAAIAFVAALALAGCSPTNPGAAETTADGGLTTVTLGLIPITDVAPIYLGIEQGIFADHGMELDIQLAQGGAAIVPAVVSGEYDFGYSNVVSLLVAHQNEIPIQVISNGSTSTNIDGADTTEVAALASSGIESILDLEGKTVAINALSNFGEITIRHSLEQAGGDPDLISFVEVPYPNMPAQLAAGEVDAAWTTEPFRTQILQEGGVIAASPMVDMAENFDSAFYFASAQTVETNPELVASFREALSESFAFASAHEDAVRAIIQDYASLSPDLAATVGLSQWIPEINRAGLETLAAAAISYGVLGDEPDYDGFIAK
ncbi:ABC transporter substrate-binding protein [Cryobacterium aureum]|uniref:ABC transporter substrate-binding protein n=1 Tax=Cryobacterium aureum TaxID=995037 RepID=UPI0013751BC5|nr:ABC transporter substrate-binding protein [Cryobacterium aureum]